MISAEDTNKKALFQTGLFGFQDAQFLFGNYVGRAGPFFTLTNFELDRLAFIKICIAAGLYFRMMDEEIFAAPIRSDKTKTLTCIKPFYFTCTHFSYS